MTQRFIVTERSFYLSNKTIPHNIIHFWVQTKHSLTVCLSVCLLYSIFAFCVPCAIVFTCTLQTVPIYCCSYTPHYLFDKSVVAWLVTTTLCQHFERGAGHCHSTWSALCTRYKMHLCVTTAYIIQADAVDGGCPRTLKLTL